MTHAIVSYKEGVAGSIGHRPLVNHLETAVFCEHREKTGKRYPGVLLQPERSRDYGIVPNAASIALAAESCMNREP